MDKPRWGKKVSRKCPICGNTYDYFPADPRETCSNSCGRRLYNKKIGLGGVVTLPCGYCGKPITRRISRLKKGKVKAFYCNRASFYSARYGKHFPGACEPITGV